MANDLRLRNRPNDPPVSSSSLRWTRLALLLYTLLFLPLAWAQMEIGRISGTVADSSGARISRAQIVLENPLSGRKSETIAGDQGQFQFENVPYGAYVVRVSAAGFKARPQISVCGRMFRFAYR